MVTRDFSGDDIVPPFSASGRRRRPLLEKAGPKSPASLRSAVNRSLPLVARGCFQRATESSQLSRLRL